MHKFYLSIIFCFSAVVTLAQKQTLDHSVYDTWEDVEGLRISDTGDYISFSLTPQQGDARLIITRPDGNRLWDIPRGENANFIGSSSFVVFEIKPLHSETRRAKIKKKKGDDLPQDTLALVDIENNEILKWANVSKYKTPREGSGYLGFLTRIESDTVGRIDTMGRDSSKTKTNSKVFNLHIRNLATANEKIISNVDDFYFDEDGKSLVFTRSSKDLVIDSTGLYYVDLQNWKIKHLSTGRGTYTNITFDKAGKRLAFTAEKSPEKELLKPYSLYYYTAASDSAIVIADANTQGIPSGWNVSGNGDIRFSTDGAKLFFGLAPIPRVKDTTLVEFEVAKVDIWHWKDDYLQPQQLVNLKRDLRKSYLAVMHLNQMDKVVPLGSPEIPDIQLTEDANEDMVLGSTNVGSRIESQWQGRSKLDFYLISTVTGQKIPVAMGVYGYPYLDPKGEHVLWFDLETQEWTHYDISKAKTTILNKGITVSFGDEDNDEPTFSRAYGIAGWDTETTAVYLYDKYDIWRFNLLGGKAENITDGRGRSEKVTFRYYDLEPKSRIRTRRNATTLNGDSVWLLSAFDHESKAHGWFRFSFKDKINLSAYGMAPYLYRQLETSENADLFVYTKENYKSSPDVYVSRDFQQETRLSHINPQQEEYVWGSAELVHWTTPNDHKATGILYKPENFDPTKTYPMIVYFYEKLSDRLYSYIPPAPTPSRLNISFFVSNGYLVFAPDIEYEIGYPGRSAEEFVNSGVAFLSKNNWVDSDHIGIQGQSWGGYQVAHLITRTNMYAAAWSGAPVVNMTSAYGGIRWTSGRNRQFQYEKTQSRIGKDLWDGLDLYLENSPLFHLQNVNTPVVIMANDSDGSVPWYQGIEMFTALRRLQKPVWMLNYNGDEHNLMLRQNRKDIQRREQQFFDHFLKGAPAPVWIEYGVPATLKGIDWGFELVK